MSDKKKPEDTDKSGKPKKPSLIKTAFKGARKHPVAAAAGAGALVLGSGFIGAAAAAAAAGTAYKNRDKIGKAIKDPDSVKGAMNEGFGKLKGLFGSVVDNAKEGLQDGEAPKDEKPEASTNEQPKAKPRRKSGPSND